MGPFIREEYEFDLDALKGSPWYGPCANVVQFNRTHPLVRAQVSYDGGRSWSEPVVTFT